MNKKTKQRPNGVQPPTYEQLREGVLLDELKARHWKAQWETAYYHLEFEKILPEYRTLLETKEKEAREKMEKELKEMMESKNKDEMLEVEVTQDILDLNPEMVEQGVKIGEVIKIPKNSDLTPEEEEQAVGEFKVEHPELFDGDTLRAV